MSVYLLTAQLILILWVEVEIFEIKGNSIVAEFINFSNNTDEINRSYQNEVNCVHSNYNYLRNDIIVFNNSLKSHIHSVLS